MSSTRRRLRMGVRSFVLALLIIGGAMDSALTAGQAPPPPAGPEQGAVEPTGFRQFPGGKVVPDLRAGLPPRVAAAALRADADRQLPEGLRLRDDGEPFVAPVGGNSLFRFGLEYRGIRLADGSTYVAIVGRNGKLLSSRFQNIPRAVDATVPTVGASAAVATATDHARNTLGQSGTLSETAPVLEVWVDAQQQGHLSWSMTVRETREGTVRAATQYQVAAIDTPVVLSWADVIRYDTIHARVDVWDLSPNLPTVTAPLWNARAILNGALVSTDDQGRIVGAANPPGSSLQASLIGPFARIFSGAGASFTPSATSAGGDETVLFAANSEFTLAQTTAFTWVTYTNRWVRSFLPFLNSTSTALDSMGVFVNENISCNAFSTGGPIHFGRATSQCNNMATPTILVHEFGHSLHNTLAGGSFDASFSEGFGDALAALVTRQPCLGPGAVRGSETCMRDATDVTTWPVSSSDVHEIGRPFAQFVWALASDIGFEAATEIVLGATMAGPSSVPDAVRLSFVADDDDGLLGTCSPHQKALEAAADSRLLPRPQNCRPAGDNQPPTARDDAFSFTEDDGGRDIDLVGNDTDPDGDQLVVSVVQPGQLGTLDCSPMPCRYVPRRDANGTESLTYTVVDTFGGEATATVRIQIAPVEDPLSVSGHGNVQGFEDVPAPVFASVADPDGPAFAMRWFVGAAGSPAPCTFAEPLSASTTLTCTHEGRLPVRRHRHPGRERTRRGARDRRDRQHASLRRHHRAGSRGLVRRAGHRRRRGGVRGRANAGPAHLRDQLGRWNGDCRGSRRWHVHRVSCLCRRVGGRAADRGQRAGRRSRARHGVGLHRDHERRPHLVRAPAGPDVHRGRRRDGRTTAASGVRVHGRRPQRAADRTDAVARRELAIPHRRLPLAVAHRRPRDLRRYRVAQRATWLRVRVRGHRQPPAPGARRSTRYASRRDP